jgi:hypothetical protein
MTPSCKELNDVASETQHPMSRKEDAALLTVQYESVAVGVTVAGSLSVLEA